jgi:4-hydroxybenzoate polyprenyltransferase
VPSDRIWTYGRIAAALAVAGWVWAFIDPLSDPLWFLTIALTVIAMALLIYADVRDRRARH